MTPDTQVQPYSAVVAEIARTGVELQEQAESFVIACDEDDVGAKTLLAQVRGVLKDADVRRKEIKEPYLRTGKQIDDAFKTAAAPWKAAETALISKTGAYHKQKIEAEQAALRERERLERSRQAAMNTVQAVGQLVDGQPDLPPVPAPVATTTRTAAGDVSMVAHRGFQIVDVTLIPREYLVPDRVAIGKAYRDGFDVPGCKEDVTYTPRATGR